MPPYRTITSNEEPKKGLFVIKPSGDTVAIINDADFQPNTW